MPRQTRRKSGTGIYHVMLRGINRQDISEEEEDYLHFLKSMSLGADSKDDADRHIPSPCTFYAYCLMPNHIHLLLQERTALLAGAFAMHDFYCIKNAPTKCSRIANAAELRRQDADPNYRFE